jgi:hypothetical protein
MRANWPAELRCNGHRARCTVMDVSSTGASLCFDYLPDQKSSVWLIVENMAPISASIVWRNKNHAGVRFQVEQEWILEACKRRFDPVAWLRA